MPLTGLPNTVEQRTFTLDVEKRGTELPVVGRLDFAAELRAHGLLAVADTEHRNARLEHALRSLRRRRFGHRCRPAGQDDRFGWSAVERRFGPVVRHDLAVDTTLAHAPGDELGDLRAKIDDEDALAHGAALAR